MDWKDVLEFLVAYKSEILLVAAAIVSFSWEWFKSTGVGLMLQMEKEARENLELTGPDKMCAVIQLLNEKYFKGVVPETVIHYLAQKWYDEAMGK